MSKVSGCFLRRTSHEGAKAFIQAGAQGRARLQGFDLVGYPGEPQAAPKPAARPDHGPQVSAPNGLPAGAFGQDPRSGRPVQDTA